MHIHRHMCEDGAGNTQNPKERKDRFAIHQIQQRKSERFAEKCTTLVAALIGAVIDGVIDNILRDVMMEFVTALIGSKEAGAFQVRISS